VDGTGAGELDTDSGTVLLRSATETQIDNIEADTNELQGNQGNWLTAVGFSTHSAADVVTALGDGSTLTACLTATGFLDAAGVRTAIGLASANLDTQLADIPTVSEFEARTLVAADYFVVTDYTAPDNTNIGNIHDIVKSGGTGDCAAILADTSELQGNQGNWATATGFATEAKQDVIDGIVDAILVDTNELQTNQGNWVTATGFSTHNAAAVVTALKADAQWKEILGMASGKQVWDASAGTLTVYDTDDTTPLFVLTITATGRTVA
jgi:hypothetical protein